MKSNQGFSKEIAQTCPTGRPQRGKEAPHQPKAGREGNPHTGEEGGPQEGQMGPEAPEGKDKSQRGQCLLPLFRNTDIKAFLNPGKKKHQTNSILGISFARPRQTGIPKEYRSSF